MTQPNLAVVSAAGPALASVESLRERLPDFAKDIRLNLGSVLGADGAPDLTEAQIFGIALASACATRCEGVIAAIAGEAQGKIDEATVQAAHAAATIMAMHNVYYRSTHLAGDEEIRKMPARLRMNVIGQPGIAKADFEMMCLAVSAINGCGMCMESHTHEVTKAGLSKAAVQSAVRIAAVVNAAAQALQIPSAA
ncbi:MAG: alkyl hydroperoxide reductase [Alphaproteobacteria bacterium]|nr:alkyl hydroperoxide reductase [Alphaproteobacteria bacterium]